MIGINELGCICLDPVNDIFVFAIPIQIAHVAKVDCLARSGLNRNFKVIVLQDQHRFKRILLGAPHHGFYSVVTGSAAIVLIIG